MGSGHDVVFRESEPRVGLTAQSLELLQILCLPPSVSAPPPLAHMLSVSLKYKQTLKTKTISNVHSHLTLVCKTSKVGLNKFKQIYTAESFGVFKSVSKQNIY